MEIWKPIDGTSYEVSNLGRVKGPRKILKPFSDTCGYQQVDVRGNKAIHKLVANAFLGETPAGMRVDHIDGNKLNNALTNLEIVTHSENIKRAFRIGLKNSVGDNHNGAILRSENIPEIRSLYATGVTQHEIGRRFGVTNHTIHKIIKGKLWGHVK